MTVAAPTYTGYIGGESRTLLVDGTLYGSAPAGWTNVTTPVKTGVGAIQIAENGSQAATAGSVVAFINTAIRCWHAWVVQSGAPSAAGCLAGDTRAGYGYYVALEKNTDSKIRLVQIPVSGVWADRTALTDFSATALATDNSTFKEVCLWIDPLTLGTSHIWATLFIDNTQQWSVDIGAVLTAGLCQFYLCPAVANTTINVVYDDVTGLSTTSTADAPHLKDWPQPEVWRQLAIADTAQDDWINEAGGDADFSKWADATGPDNDTSCNRCTTPWAGKYQASDGQTETTVGIDTYTLIQSAQADGQDGGPAINIVYRDEGDGAKWASSYINSLGISGAAPPVPGTTYIGHAATFYHSGGWVITDVTALNFGCAVITGAEHNDTWRVTLCMMQWLAYVNVYDHALFTTPALPGGVETTPAPSPAFMGLGVGIL